MRFRHAMLALLCAAPLQAQTPVQWRQDVAYLANTLRSVHPEPFHQTSPAAFDAAVRSLNADIPRLSADRVLVRMISLVALLQDAHTHINLHAASVYPVRIFKFADGIFVTAVRPDDARNLGAEVISINGRSANAVYDSVQRIVPGDNPFAKMEDVPRYITLPQILHGLGLGDSSKLQLTVKQTDGTQAVWTLEPVAAGNDHFAWILGRRAPGGATQFETAANADLVYQNSDRGYWIGRDGDILYAKFNLVQDSPDSVVVMGQRVKLGFSDFGRRLVALIDSSDATKLVVDLRDNSGGNNELAKAIVTGIANSRLNKRGQLFVITGRRTYSAAMNFTSLMEDQTRAIFVGEAPGGSPQHNGDATNFTLPNSKLTFNVSTLHWDLGVAPMDARVFMEPDIPAPPLHADVVRGRDGALDAVRSYNGTSILSERLTAIRKEKGFDAAVEAYRATPHDLKAPWNSDVQQLLAFAWGTVRGGSREDIFKAFRFVTDTYPDSHLAWFETARIYTFVRDWKEVVRTLQMAATLRPQHNLTQRLLAAAKAR